MFKYEIYTTIPRDFDPEVEGITLDSIVKSCKGYVNHSIPLNMGNTIIKIETSQPLEIKYIVDQLNAEFQIMGEETSVVQRVVRKNL